MGEMADLDLRVREAIQNGCTWEYLIDNFDHSVGLPTLAKLWEEYHGPYNE